MTLQQDPSQNKVFMSTTVDPGIKESIDKVRGILSRSQYVQQAVVERVAKDMSRIRSSANKK